MPNHKHICIFGILTILVLGSEGRAASSECDWENSKTAEVLNALQEHPASEDHAEDLVCIEGVPVFLRQDPEDGGVWVSIESGRFEFKLLDVQEELAVVGVLDNFATQNQIDISDGGCLFDQPAASEIYKTLSQHRVMRHEYGDLVCHAGVPELAAIDRSGGFWVETRGDYQAKLIWLGGRYVVSKYHLPDGADQWRKAELWPNQERDWWLGEGSGISALMGLPGTDCAKGEDCGLQALAEYLPAADTDRSAGVNPYAQSLTSLDDLPKYFPDVQWAQRKTGDIMWREGCQGVAIFLTPNRSLLKLPGKRWDAKRSGREREFEDELGESCDGGGELRIVRPTIANRTGRDLENDEVEAVWNDLYVIPEGGGPVGPYYPHVNPRDTWYASIGGEWNPVGFFSDPSVGGDLSQSSVGAGLVPSLALFRRLEQGEAGSDADRLGAFYVYLSAGAAYRARSVDALAAAVGLGVQAQFVTGYRVTPYVSVGAQAETAGRNPDLDLNLTRSGLSARAGADFAIPGFGSRVQPGIWVGADASRFYTCASGLDGDHCSYTENQRRLETIDPYHTGHSVRVFHPAVGLSLNFSGRWKSDERPKTQEPS